jgi:iron uptake system component EfeO
LKSRIAAVVVALLALACGKRTLDDDQKDALNQTKAFIAGSLDDLVDAAVALQAAAPAPQADGWNATRDAAALDAMKAQWKKARTAYEHVEGAIAILFPELDVSTDQRYDGFLTDYGEDTDLFDDQDVTGIHAIERILWSPSIPQRVVQFEQGLVGYQPARFPQSADEATRFKTRLCQRLVDDLKTMRDQFKPLALDPAAAFRGVIGSMREQIEKAEKAASGEEESRYAQYTLADMRVNVEAGLKTYEAFRGWVIDAGGADLDVKILAGFKVLTDQYAAIGGDALPAVPATWSSANPSAADLQTPYGQLWQALQRQADPDADGSVVNAMTAAADLLKIRQVE